jgi:UDP-N-acetylglucosamine 4-epimerase
MITEPLLSRLHALDATLPRGRFLVTGGAGFIGSHLVEALLTLKRSVTVLDNMSSGKMINLERVLEAIPGSDKQLLTVIEGDITDRSLVEKLVRDSCVVLHQAARGSVPRSIDNPLATHDANVNGFLSVLEACRLNPSVRLVYASSSSVYGDDPHSPKKEGVEGEVLSPYALSKSINEQYASMWYRCYHRSSIGLRYFNVFGPRQDPEGAYAAVIPRWIATMVRGQPCDLFGDGSTSRDFCYIDNVVNANLSAAITDTPGAHTLNIALGGNTSLLMLHKKIADTLHAAHGVERISPVMHPFRAGDILHSCAQIDKARTLLGYEPLVTLDEGINKTVQYFVGSVTR